MTCTCGCPAGRPLVDALGTLTARGQAELRCADSRFEDGHALGEQWPIDLITPAVKGADVVQPVTRSVAGNYRSARGRASLGGQRGGGHAANAVLRTVLVVVLCAWLRWRPASDEKQADGDCSFGWHTHSTRCHTVYTEWGRESK